MADIKLPLLPESFPAGYIAQTEYFYTREQLRARDIEVARCVLEAAASVCERKRMVRGGEIFGAEIRALKVTHD